MYPIKTWSRSFATATALVLTACLASSQGKEHVNVEDGVALSGFDPVSYFSEGGGKPRKGEAELTAQHEGVTYRFVDAKNKALFEGLPQRYVPAYGGWCAWAMVEGDQVEVDPESYLIEEGRLLVFYDGFFADTRKKWKKKGGAELAPQADRSWKKIAGVARPRSLANFNLDEGVALHGFDPIGYAEGQPVPGKVELAAWYQGVTYRFATEANRARFLTSPDAFEPRYGGYCAWAMAKGKKVDIDPAAYARDENGLFVFYNGEKRDDWNANTEAQRRSADATWAELQSAR